jgi:signal peptidase I
MKTFRRWLPDILFLLLLFAARSSLADHYYVPSGSMEYTIMPGDRVFVDKTAYGIEFPFLDFQLLAGDTPVAGEVAIFDSPADGIRLIKRIVAVAGDRLELRSGQLILNGETLVCDDDATAECFASHYAKLNLEHGWGQDVAPFVVPAGKVVAIGDSRGNSRDSRYFGLVDEASLYGRAVSVFYRQDQGFQWQKL